jgi:CheY-like chemotaxis protein
VEIQKYTCQGWKASLLWGRHLAATVSRSRQDAAPAAEQRIIGFKDLNEYRSKMVMPQRKSIIIAVDDDEDDRLLIEQAIRDNGFAGQIHLFEDGQKLMEHLSYDFAPASVILLDLNMPQKGGREILREIKCDPNLRSIPIVIFSTSAQQEDIEYCYECGANTYMVKPSSYGELKKNMGAFIVYWFQVAVLESSL